MKIVQNAMPPPSMKIDGAPDVFSSFFRVSRVLDLKNSRVFLPGFSGPWKIPGFSPKCEKITGVSKISMVYSMFFVPGFIPGFLPWTRDSGKTGRVTRAAVLGGRQRPVLV